MTAERYVPSREDRFSFGIWTVGWQGVDVFGSAVRPPMAAERAVYKLAGLGAYGVNFHDNDVFAFDATPAERDERIGAFKKALQETGLVVTTATTNLFGHPMFKDGAFTANERSVRRFALSKVMRNPRNGATRRSSQPGNGRPPPRWRWCPRPGRGRRRRHRGRGCR